jgi:hypothetical protein
VFICFVSAGQDILDFYGDMPTRHLYKEHISFMVNRVNKFTGVKYKGDELLLLAHLNSAWMPGS